MSIATPAFAEITTTRSARHLLLSPDLLGPPSEKHLAQPCLLLELSQPKSCQATGESLGLGAGGTAGRASPPRSPRLAQAAGSGSPACLPAAARASPVGEEAHPTQLHCTFLAMGHGTDTLQTAPYTGRGAGRTPSSPLRHLVATSTSLLLLRVPCSASLITKRMSK